ncbi:MAG TPA: hypothetical protein VF142_03760 [Longimicrobium sp.]
MQPNAPVDYAAVIATLLAISLAGERIVAVLKTMFPAWLAEPLATPGTAPVGIQDDKGRRLRVQAVAFLACWVASASLLPGDFNLVGTLHLGGLALNVVVVGLLTMGGSAFWTQVLGISSALKDLKKAQANDAAGTSAEKAAGRKLDMTHVPIHKPEPARV